MSCIVLFKLIHYVIFHIAQQSESNSGIFFFQAVSLDITTMLRRVTICRLTRGMVQSSMNSWSSRIKITLHSATYHNFYR